MTLRVSLAASVLALVWAWSTAAVAASSEQDQLKALRERLERLKREATETQSGRAEVADQLKGSERAISESTRAVRETQTAHRQVRDEMRGIEDRGRKVEAEAAARSRELERVLRSRYVHSDQDFLRLLLSGEDPDAIARDAHYMSYVSQAHVDLIRNLRANNDELARLGQQLRTKADELARLEARNREERAKLERERGEWQRTYTKLSGQLQSQRREIQSLQANEQRLARLVEQLSRAIRERPAVPSRPSGPSNPRSPLERNEKVPEAGLDRGVFSTLRGRMRLPVRGDIAERFGAPRAEGGPPSKGLFIRAKEGEEVRAIASGRVVFAEWMRGFGNLMIVDHGDAFLTIYGNNESLLRRTGEAVRMGDTVATVGRTGGNETAGLYFELRHQGRAIDPLGWVSLR